MLKNVVVPLSLLLLSGVAARPPPPGWRASDPTEAAARSLQDEIELTFLLKIDPARVSTLESEVLARADPSSASYGKPHLTNDEVHAMVAPAVEHVQAVTSYREQGGGGRETTTLDPTPPPPTQFKATARRPSLAPPAATRSPRAFRSLSPNSCCLL